MPKGRVRCASRAFTQPLPDTAVQLRVLGLFCLAALATLGCATADLEEGQPAPTADAAQRPATVAGTAEWLRTPAAHDWTHWWWPGKKNLAFKPTRKLGRPAVTVQVEHSMSVLRQPFQPSAQPLAPGPLRFSWMVDRLFPLADLAKADQDDAPVRIVLAFDGDRNKLSARARMQSELSRAVLGEEMPYATLTYVWCNTRPVGTVLVSARTDRVRKIVVESGAANVGQWLDYERDVQADFIKAFGEPPGPLIGIALMSDGDNTRGSATAWYGPLSLQSKPTPH